MGVVAEQECPLYPDGLPAELVKTFRVVAGTEV